MSSAKIEKSVLLLNEFQKEWLDPRGCLHGMLKDKKALAATLAAARTAVDAARSAGLRVVHAGVFLSSDYAELGAASRGLRCDLPRDKRFAGEMADLVAPFAPLGNEFTVAGRAGTSVFTGSNLDVYLRNNRVEHVYLAGFAAHVCINATMMEAYDRGYDVTLLADACGSFVPAQRDFVVENIVHHFGEALTAQQFAGRLLLLTSVPSTSGSPRSSPKSTGWMSRSRRPGRCRSAGSPGRRERPRRGSLLPRPCSPGRAVRVVAAPSSRPSSA